MVTKITEAPTNADKIKDTHSDQCEIYKESPKERYKVTEFGENIIEVHCGVGA